VEIYGVKITEGSGRFIFSGLYRDRCRDSSSRNQIIAVPISSSRSAVEAVR
jgi:hypothetical protein